MSDRSALPRDPVMVARERERDVVLAVAEAARSRGGTVLITGESGLGKTTLIGDIASRITGWTVLRAQSDSFEADLDFSTIDALATSLGVPLRTSGPVSVDDPIAVGRNLLDALDSLDAPVCLIIDDAQWIDSASSHALRFVIRRLDGQPILVIAAARAVSGELTDLLHNRAVTDRDGNAHVTLTPFLLADTRELASALLGRSISRRTAAQLTRVSDGSPLLLTMLLGHARDTLTEALHPAGIDIQLPTVSPLSSTVDGAMLRATTAARTAAEVAAVLRDPTPAAVFGTVIERLGEPGDVDAARALGLVRLQERDGITAIVPAHALLAEAVIARMTLDRRRAIHRAAAAVLTGHRALGHRVEGAERADRELIEDLLFASREAAENAHADQAMSYARSAVQLATAGDSHEKGLLEIGLLAMRTRQQERIFDLIPALESLPTSAVRDLILLELYVLTGNLAGGFAAAQAVLASTGADAGSRMVRAYAAADIPMIQLATRDFPPVVGQVAVAKALLADAPTEPSAGLDPAMRWMVQPQQILLRLLGWQLTAAGYGTDRQLLEESIAAFDAQLAVTPDSPAVIDALVAGSRVQLMLGDIQKVNDDLARANRLIRYFPTSWTAGLARTIFAHVLFLVGRWDESVALADTAVAFALDETDLSSWPVALTVSALVRAARAEASAVNELLRSADDAPHRGPAGPYDPDIATIARAELARAQGDPVSQLAATEDAQAAPAPGSSLGWLTYRIEALAALGRSQEARSALSGCSAPGSHWSPAYGSLSWLEARVLQAEGDAEAALARFHDAVSDEESATFPFPHAVAQLDFARLLRAHGMSSSAEEALVRAAATFRGIGAAPYLARCVDELDELRARQDGSAHCRTLPADPFAPLTTRERQVAHAISTGLTNREVADQLYVSVTTVNFHVRNVLSKLNLRSRRELRGLAREPGVGHSDAPVREPPVRN